jgi:hypothetical protein
VRVAVHEKRVRWNRTFVKYIICYYGTHRVRAEYQSRCGPPLRWPLHFGERTVEGRVAGFLTGTRKPASASKSGLTSRKHRLNPQKILIGTQNTSRFPLSHAKQRRKDFLIGTEIALFRDAISPVPTRSRSASGVPSAPASVARSGTHLPQMLAPLRGRVVVCNALRHERGAARANPLPAEVLKVSIDAPESHAIHYAASLIQRGRVVGIPKIGRASCRERV